MNKVYLAARLGRRAELAAYADDLRAIGMTVTSRWVRGGHEWVGVDDGQLSIDIAARFAAEDIEDVNAADLFVIFTDPPRASPQRGGKHVELGYALARSLPIICVGPVENVFYALPSVTRCATWPDVIARLDRSEAA